MKDEDAIRLFVRDGGVAREWHAVDQIVRNHYEKLALEGITPALGDHQAVVAGVGYKEAPRYPSRGPLS